MYHFVIGFRHTKRNTIHDNDGTICSDMICIACFIQQISNEVGSSFTDINDLSVY